MKQIGKKRGRGMIELDDAGGGCPIGGVAFAARRVETNEARTVYQTIQDKKEQKCETLLFDLIQALRVTKEEEIRLCRGVVFDSFERYLKQQGYYVTRGEIVGKTNDVAENGFLLELWKIGLPKTIRLYGRNYKKFHLEVLLWYNTFYRGESLLKNKPKRHEKDFLLNRVHHHPHLVAYLLKMNYEEKQIV